MHSPMADPLEVGQAFPFNDPLASYSQYDRDAYIQVLEPPHLNRMNNDDAQQPWDAQSIAESRYPWKMIDENEQLESVDESLPCRLYLAESSIPNSGLGVYSGIDLQKGEKIGNPDIVIPLLDLQWHSNVNEDKTLLFDYPWEPGNAEKSQFEADTVHLLIPGLGMAANSHLGLANTILMTFTETNLYRGLLERNIDPGTGATTEYYNYAHTAMSDIQAGMELFVDYGAGYFRHREHKYGPIPTADDYEKADDIVREFLSEEESEDHNQVEAMTKNRQEEWDSIRINDVKHLDVHVRVALPKMVDELPHALEVGTAKHLLPNQVQDLKQLEENGQCMDNLLAGPSNIPQAGRGAFATRFLKKGSIIAPAPLLPIDYEVLRMYDEEMDETTKERRKGAERGMQLMLNYCFGHPKSSLLLFPYSTAVNFINHGGGKHNAVVRWSQNLSTHLDWLKMPLEETGAKNSTGLVLDIVATRDIMLGEEVLIDYGPSWEDAWNRHLQQWEPVTDGFKLASSFNENSSSVIRTFLEQKKDPYPRSIETSCFYEPPPPNDDDKTDSGDKKKGKKGFTPMKWTSERFKRNDQLRPCRILSRKRINGIDFYVAYMRNVHVDKRFAIQEEEKRIVSHIPRYAIVFTEKPYRSNQHLAQAFRKEIGLPDSLWPSEWIDLK